jgi:hypothetical protein
MEEGVREGKRCEIDLGYRVCVGSRRRRRKRRCHAMLSKQEEWRHCKRHHSSRHDVEQTRGMETL